MIRWLALNRSLPLKRFRYYGIPSIVAWLDSRTTQRKYSGPIRLILPCSKCKRRKWAEEVVGNYGWCDDCFNASLEDYQNRWASG